MPEAHVLDSFAHNEESSEGPVFVFLHGNPGSSWLCGIDTPGG